MNSDIEPDELGSIDAPLPPRPAAARLQTYDMGLPIRSNLPALPITDDTDIGGPPLQKPFTRRSVESLNPLLATMRRPVVTKDCMTDPLNRAFLDKTWQAVAENNVKLYRQVFRCMPDSEVVNWTQYHAAMGYIDRFAQSQGMDESHSKMQQESHGRTGPPGHDFGTHSHKFAKVKQQTSSPNKPKGLARQISEAILRKPGSSRPSTMEHGTAGEKASSASAGPFDEKDRHTPSPAGTSGSHVDFDTRPLKEKQTSSAGAFNEKSELYDGDTNTADATEPQKRRKRANTKSSARSADGVLGRAEAETVVNLIQGHLVEWPYDW